MQLYIFTPHIMKTKLLQSSTDSHDFPFFSKEAWDDLSEFAELSYSGDQGSREYLR